MYAISNPIYKAGLNELINLMQIAIYRFKLNTKTEQVLELCKAEF